MVTTRSRSAANAEQDSPTAKRRRLQRGSQSFGGHHIPNEIFMLILDILPFEDRASMAAVCSQVRPLALRTIDKLKVMRDLPYCSPAPASFLSPGWVKHRVGSPAQNLQRFQAVIVRCSSVLTYLNLLGSNILSQDLLSWIYSLHLPRLENIKFPNGTDLYLCLLRDLASRPAKWSRLNQISIGFGSKLEVPEECLELVRIMRQHRPTLKSNIARCPQWLYFTDSRVRCLLCGNSICSQHFTRAAGNHCTLSLRIKCRLKHHSMCAFDHERRGCSTLTPDGRRWPCFKNVIQEDAASSLAEDSLQVASDIID